MSRGESSQRGGDCRDRKLTCLFSRVRSAATFDSVLIFIASSAVAAASTAARCSGRRFGPALHSATSADSRNNRSGLLRLQPEHPRERGLTQCFCDDGRDSDVGGDARGRRDLAEHVGDRERPGGRVDLRRDGLGHAARARGGMRRVRLVREEGPVSTGGGDGSARAAPGAHTRAATRVHSVRVTFPGCTCRGMRDAPGGEGREEGREERVGVTAHGDRRPERRHHGELRDAARPDQDRPATETARRRCGAGHWGGVVWRPAVWGARAGGRGALGGSRAMGGRAWMPKCTSRPTRPYSACVTRSTRGSAHAHAGCLECLRRIARAC